jgi:hypothetical protein
MKIILIIFLIIINSKKINERLEEKMKSNQNISDIMIIFEEQYNEKKPTFENIMIFTKRTQKETISYLKTNNLKFKTYYTTNSISIRNISNKQIHELEKNKMIKYILLNTPFKVQQETIFQKNDKIQRIEWNIDHIQAPLLWRKNVIKFFTK